MKPPFAPAAALLAWALCVPAAPALADPAAPPPAAGAPAPAVRTPPPTPVSRPGALAPADALLAGHSAAAAALAYGALGPQANPLRESWRQNNWGLALMRMGRPARAVEHFRAAVEADRRNDVARSNLGAAYEQVGDLTKALAVYGKALELLRQAARSRGRGAGAQGVAAEDGEGLATDAAPAPVASPAERPCALDARALRLALDQANALMAGGRYAEARDAYAALGRVPGEAREGWRLNNWGLCDLRLARPDLARERLSRAVAVSPSNGTAWGNLAVADEQLGLEAEAAAAFARGGLAGRDADPQRLELVRVKLKLAALRRRLEAAR